MTLGSLFAGIGGFELAATWAGITPVWSNEIDPFACKVLRKNFDHKILEGDLRNFDYESVDIISGGFPCQPFSHAGRRKGEEDDRFLWFEMLDIIKAVRPRYVIGENVVGLLSMENGKTLDKILTSLENARYQAEVYIIPACGVGAWHKRDRLWIVAQSKNVSNATSQRQPVSGRSFLSVSSKEDEIRKANISVSNGERWGAEPNVGRVANGVSNRMDRLKGLGNAIVPQVAYQIFKAILEHDHR